MEWLTDTPSPTVLSDPHNVWMESNTRRKELFKSICQKTVYRFIHFQFNETPNDSITDLVQAYGMQLLDVGRFYLKFSDAVKEENGD